MKRTIKLKFTVFVLILVLVTGMTTGFAAAEVFVIRLDNSHIVSGRVLDADTKEPIPHAEITVSVAEGFGSDTWTVCAEGTGKTAYKLKLPKQSAPYRVAVSAEGYTTAYENVTVNNNVTHDFYLKGDGSNRFPLSGYVWDADTKKPIPGAVIFVSGIQGAGADMKLLTAGDTDAFYAQMGLPTGAYRFAVSAEGYDSAKESFTVSKITTHNFYLKKAEQIITPLPDEPGENILYAEQPYISGNNYTFQSPTYKISLSETTAYSFDNLTVGYVALSSLIVTITNTGTGGAENLVVDLSGTNSTDFTVTQPASTTLTGSGTTTFTVAPNIGLSASVSAYTATVTVTGDNGISQAFDISIRVMEEVILSYVSASGTYSTGFNVDFDPTINGGTGTGCIYAVASGTLPPGLSINPSTGRISGTPSVIGAYTVTITVTDSDGNVGTCVVTITIS